MPTTTDEAFARLQHLAATPGNQLSTFLREMARGLVRLTLEQDRDDALGELEAALRDVDWSYAGALARLRFELATTEPLFVWARLEPGLTWPVVSATATAWLSCCSDRDLGRRCSLALLEGWAGRPSATVFAESFAEVFPGEPPLTEGEVFEVLHDAGWLLDDAYASVPADRPVVTVPTGGLL